MYIKNQRDLEKAGKKKDFSISKSILQINSTEQGKSNTRRRQESLWVHRLPGVVTTSEGSLSFVLPDQAVGSGEEAGSWAPLKPLRAKV